MAALPDSSLTAATTNGSHPSSESLAVQPAGSQASSPSLLTAPGVSRALHADVAADRDAELRSGRSDLERDELDGTVAFHERHVFLYYKGGEATDSASLPSLLAAAMEARKSDFTKITGLCICEGNYGIESAMGDVLLFPSMVLYRGLSDLDVENFVENVLVKNVEWILGSPKDITGSHIFVFCDGGKDTKLGVCGRTLIANFKEEIRAKGLDGVVTVTACSNMGTHAYAGNVIIFSSDAKEKKTGSWCGYVTDNNVGVTLQKHIVDRLSRGQLGVSKENQKNVQFDVNSAPMPETLVEPKPSSQDAGEMFRIPQNFNGNTELIDSKLHHIASARELQKAVNKSKNWLTRKLSFALIKNGKLFAIPASDISDLLFVKSGAVCVVENDQLPHVVMTRRLYTNSEKKADDLQEHEPEKSDVFDVKLIKSDYGGNGWVRRKYSIEGYAYHVLQWRPRDPDSKAKLNIKANAKQAEEEAAAAIESDEANLELKAKAQKEVGVSARGRDEANLELKAKAQKEVGVSARGRDEVHIVDEDNFSIRNCISILKSMKELSVDERARSFDILTSDQNREIFVCADAAARLVWLRRRLARPD